MIATGTRLYHLSQAIKWANTYIAMERLLWRPKTLTPQEWTVAGEFKAMASKQVRIHLHKTLNPWWDECRGWIDA